VTATGDVAIQTEALCKCYRLGLQRRGYDTLRESLVRAASRTLRSGRNRGRDASPDLWALRDVSLTVRTGEVVGLIGHNGAGKTTLLKILSRITEPTAGWADVTGRVGSLLEVGTGFHPELTGRENVFLNGAVLGMPRSEIKRRFDEIVAFAEVERFLDTPVKRYSSGMSVRLAFAVAAHLEPEILLVDEVLAVGDAAFQRKSLAKMSQVAREGRTVIVVSHNLAIVRALCERAVLLEGGKVVVDAATGVTLERYLGSLERAATGDLAERPDRDSRGWHETKISRVEIEDRAGADVILAGRPVTITVVATTLLPRMDCRLTISNSLGQPIATLDSELTAPDDERDPNLGPRMECELADLPLVPGRYRIDVLMKGREQIQDGLQAAAFFDVEPSVVAGRAVPVAGAGGDVVLRHRWRLPV
jgi:homopolymeric O-antigen transport system ATP-binding protein